MTKPSQTATPRIVATFQAQVWGHRDALIEAGSAVRFDVTHVVLEWEAAAIAGFVDDGCPSQDLDCLADEFGLLDEHRGPYDVNIETSDLQEFFKAQGVENVADLTDADLERIRAAYKDEPKPVTGSKLDRAVQQSTVFTSNPLTAAVILDAIPADVCDSLSAKNLASLMDAIHGYQQSTATAA